MILEETFYNAKKSRRSPSLKASISQVNNIEKAKKYEIVLTKSNETRTIRRIKYAPSRPAAVKLAKTWVSQ